jgi:cobalt/nickel transport system ATP-binding protein
MRATRVRPAIDTALDTAIGIANLRFAYPDGVQALKGFDLTIAAGEKVALLGPNGAGKTTLLLHLNGILRGKGDIRIMGQRLSNGNLKHFRAQVGLVFENPDDQLFSATVFDDVAFGPLHMGLPKDEVLARVRLALEQVGMSGFEERLPHHLSLGQKKRIAIATVLSMSPSILALDEPFSSLDPGARRELMRLLQRLPQTMIVSTHHISIIRHLFPRTVVMDEGRVVADGDTETILADAALLEAHGLEVF